MNSLLAKGHKAFQITAALCCLVLLLLAVLLLVLAPLLQLVFHFRWCKAHWWPVGLIVAAFTGVSLAACLWGVWRKNVSVRRAGLWLFLGSIFAVARHECLFTADGKIVLPMTVACTLSVLLIYVTVASAADSSKHIRTMP